MQQERYYSTEEVNNLIESVDYLCARNKTSSEDYQASIDRFVNNETYKGDDATASKEFMNILEKGFIDSRIDMQEKFLNMLKHYSESFAEKVDASPYARIDTVTLDISQARARNIYRELDTFCTNFENTMDYLERTYGHITTFTKPRTAEARESLAALCGGDELEAGFIYEVKQKLIRFDEEESAYVDSLLLDDDVAEYKYNIKNTNAMLLGVNVITPDINTIIFGRINEKRVGRIMTCSQAQNYTNINPEVMQGLEDAVKVFMEACGYGLEEIAPIIEKLPMLASMDDPYPFMEAIATIIGLAAAVVLIAYIIKYLAEHNIHFSKSKSKGKAEEKTKNKNKSKGTTEKPHRRNKKGEPLGKNGPTEPSKKIFQRGKKERIEIENPNPGEGNGNVHYHDVNNTKYIFDVTDGKLYYDEPPYEEAPPYIQKVLEDYDIQQAINKGLKYLGEEPYF